MKKLKIIIWAISIFMAISQLSAQNVALNLDGVNDFIQTTYSGISGGTSARSIEAWIKTTNNFNPSAGGSQGVIADYGSFVTGGRFTFCVLWSNAIRIEVGGNGLSGSIAVNDGNWHHVAVVYNPTATNKYSLYVDSVLDVSGNLTVTTNTGSTSNLRIGQRIDNVNNFTGDIDEVRFYNYARTANQIASERRAEYCSVPSGLMAYYKFNEGTAGISNATNTTATDYAGSNNGTLTGFSLSGSTSNYVAGNALTQGSSLTSSSVSTCGSYTLPSGTIVSASGTYNDTLTSTSGCDSIQSFIVTITTGHIRNTANVSQCDSYTLPNGTVVTATGVYYDTISASSSCDTVDEYNVTVLPGVNIAVTQSGNTLTSSDTWAMHQWVDCNTGFSPVVGETSHRFTPSASGSYACIVTRGTCSDTTACTQINISTIGIEERLKNQLSIFPNPASSILNITHPEKIESIQIVSLSGSLVSIYSPKQEVIYISSLPAGVYIIEVSVKDVLIRRKLIKE